MNNCNLSIICPTFNSEKTISRLINSVLGQTYKNFELIIVDGGSNDNTIPIIESYQAPQIRYITESDKGIFDAMNKGIDLAKGDWLYFIGSDDYLYDSNAFNLIFNENKRADIIFAKTFLSNGKIRNSAINYKTLFLNTVQHQGVVYKKSLFDDYRYDDSFKTNAEYELHLKLYYLKPTILCVDSILSYFSIDGVSGKAKFTGYKEEIIIRNKLIKNLALKCFLNTATMVRFGVKKILLLLGVKIHIYKV